MSLKSMEKIETNVYSMEVEIDAEAFNKELDKVFAKEGKKIQLPGFRKGKAPRSIIEKFYGEELFYDEAVNALFPEYVDEAVKESKLDVVGGPDETEIVSINKNDGVVLKMKMTVKPDVTVGQYKGLNVKKAISTVSDEDVDDEIKKLIERNARMVAVEDRAVQNGDIVDINFEGFVDGKAFDGGKAENYELTIGSGSFIDGFEDQLIGHNIDEDFEINVRFPDDYASEELKGKDAMFKIKVNGIKVKEFDEPNDEFAKDVSEFDTLDELKDSIRKEKLEKLEKESDTDVENQLIDQIIEGMEAEIPDVMYENRIDENVRDFDTRMRQQGLNLETYLKYTGMELPTFRKQFRDIAERQVKIRLALEKIVELENIVPTEDEINAEFEKLAESYKMDVDAIKKVISAGDLMEDIAVQKAVDLVKANAVVEEVERAADEAENSEEK